MSPANEATTASAGHDAGAPRVVLGAPTGFADDPGSVLPGARVITPNPRAARARGVPAVSLERLARDLLRPMGLQRASELTRWRALREAVRRGWAPQDVDGTARAVAATVREVLRAGLDGSALPHASERLRRVVELALAYRDDLLARALVDPAEALWWVARGGAHGSAPVERRRLHVVGYPRIGLAEAAFLAAVCAPGSVLELPDADDDALYEANRSVAATLEARGWRVERPGAAPGGSGPRPGVALRALRLPSRDAEVRAVLTDVKRLLAAGTAPESIALVARDDAAYGPTLRAVGWEYGLPVVTSYTVPLRDTPVGAWTATLVEAVRDDLPFEPVARLLAHPLTHGLPPGVWDAARSQHPRGPAAWSVLDGRAEALVWPRRSTRADLLARLQRAFEAFGVARRSEARLADAFAFQRLGTAAAALGMPADQEVALGAFLHDLDGLLTLLSVPTDLGRRGVELHTPLALYGSRYAHVFVLGASEGVLPQRVADDPVLDFAERRAAVEAGLALEGALAAARREALSFRAVLWTLDEHVPGASLTLSYAEDHGIASPVFTELGLVPAPPGPMPPASPEETRRRRILQPAVEDRADAGRPGGPDPVLAGARHAWEVERRREEAAAPDAYDGVVGEPYLVERHVFSATQLLDLGQCAFRWLCAVPLRLGELEEAEDDVSPLLRGRLYHRALELALQAARVAAGPEPTAHAVRDAALAALHGAFERAEAEESAAAVPAWELRRGHHLDQLERVLASESFLPEGTEVVALERWFPAWGEPPVDWRGFPVRGKVDRIDRRPEGLVLLDYKTRSSKPAGAQDERGKARVDLQLPLYLEAAAPALYPGERPAGAQYYSLTKADVLQDVRLDRGLDRAIDAFVERARARLAAGAYPVMPDIDLKACAICAFDLVCRKGPRTERMRSAATSTPRPQDDVPEDG